MIKIIMIYFLIYYQIYVIYLNFVHVNPILKLDFDVSEFIKYFIFI